MSESALDWFAQETGGKVVSLAEERLAGLEEAATDQPLSNVSFSGGYGETDPSHKNGIVDLGIADHPQREPLFSRFMDGSRMAWKIAEIAFEGKIWLMNYRPVKEREVNR